MRKQISMILLMLVMFKLPLASAGVGGKVDPVHAKPRVLVIATGGTIAGVSIPGDPQHYDPGQLTVEAILKEIPDVRNSFVVEGQQLRDPNAATPQNPNGYVNVASPYILERQWLLLARQVNQALAGNYDAVVVTHGTDTIEETGFFLQLSVQSTKPVLMVGAMRPAQGPNPPDGPDNLRTAFRLIADPGVRDTGVLVVGGFKAFPAYDVTKIRSYPANIADEDGKTLPSTQIPLAFAAPNYHELARVHRTGNSFMQWRVEWRDDNDFFKTGALRMKFDLSSATELPRVPILYQQIGNDAVELLNDFYLSKFPLIKSYVLVGSGACSLTRAIGPLITSLAPKEDLMFMRSGHVGENWCQFTQDDTNPNTTGAATLSPQHVKILLQVLEIAINANVDLGPLVARQSGFRDKVRAYFSEHVPYPYHVGGFEPIHDTPTHFHLMMNSGI